MSKAVQAAGVGKPVSFVVRRGATTRTVAVTTEASEDDAKRAVVGVQIGTGYDFPFDISVHDIVVRPGELSAGPARA